MGMFSFALILRRKQNNPYYISSIPVKGSDCFRRFYRHFALLTAVEICCKIANAEEISEHIIMRNGQRFFIIPFANVPTF
jgi:hypothetical protein